METKRAWTFGLEARLFTIIFVVASLVSAFIAVSMYTQEKQDAEQALADELIRAARMFAALLDAEDIARLPQEAPGSDLVREYQVLARHVVNSTGVANAYTCSPVRPGVCVFGVMNLDVAGTLYDYGQTEASEAWAAALSGQMAASPIHADEFGE